MKTIQVLPLIAACILGPLCDETCARPIDHFALKKAYIAFLASPDDVSSVQVLDLLPNKPVSAEGDGQEFVELRQEIFYDKENFSILEEHYRAGNVNAINVAYKLKNISDGWTAEMLDILLGSIIVSRPRLFLSGLERNFEYVARLDAVLANLGPEYVDKPSDQLSVLSKRHEAISSVSDPSLESIRRKCLSVLSGTMKDSN
jgi:hypothetical protein